MKKEIQTLYLVGGIIGAIGLYLVAVDIYNHQIILKECCYQFPETVTLPSPELKHGEVYERWCNRLGECTYV